LCATNSDKYQTLILKEHYALSDTKWNKRIIKSFRLTEGQLALIEEECRLRNVNFSAYVREATMSAIKHVKNPIAVMTLAEAG
jgi:hypothetical protein